MKKIELHCHFDGSINIQHASELLQRDPTELKQQMTAKGTKSLAEYLEKFTLPLELLQTQRNLKAFATLLAKDLVADGVIYAEVRFCPLLHTRRRISARKVVESVLEGFNAVPGITINLILCMMRQFTDKQNIRILNLASELRKDGCYQVCGVDLAGDEAAHPNSDFQLLFQMTQHYQMPLVIHAGEAASYESVDCVLDAGAVRIGHGVRAIESESTIRRLVKSQVPLEICPISNIHTGIYPDLESHPIRQLLDAGVAVTINTDNRTVSYTSLTSQYTLLREVHGFTDADFLRCNLNAALGSLASPQVKVALCKTLLADYAEHH